MIPEEQETVEDWIDGLESLNQEGVDWVRYPLELRMGEDHARLVIRSIVVAEAEGVLHHDDAGPRPVARRGRQVRAQRPGRNGVLELAHARKL